MKLTAAMTLATLILTSSAFAETRPRVETYSGRIVSVDGTIRDIDRDRNGVVIRLDRSGTALFASSRTEVYSTSRNRSTSLRQLERGDRIRATGRLSSRGTMAVSSITLVREEDDRRDRDDRTLRGVVESVDAARRIVSMRDDRTGRSVEVDMRGAERNDRRWDNEGDRDSRRDRWNDISRIHRGDRITISGDWRSNGRFEAERYNVSDNGRR